MYVERDVESNVLRLFKEYPVVTVTGPRQSGKSTMCKKLFPGLPYVSLEDTDNRNFALDDPRGFLARWKAPAVLDEIQRAPDLLSYLQTVIDEKGETGMYVLTGSRQFELMEAISQSLAGRTALVRLLPFCLDEVRRFKDVEELSLTDALYRGFYPRILLQAQNPSEAYSFYVSTYLERDVRRILKVQNLRLFEMFLKVCAGRTGQLLNCSEIANECGVDQKTIHRWLSVLEASYIVRILSPYYKNLNKRLTKMPKLYFYDTGLACYLLGIRKPEHLVSHPLFGALFETYVVGELLKNAYNNIKDDDLYFFRDNRGREVDVVHDRVDSVDLMEIKSGSTVNKSFFKGLKYVSSLPVNIHSSHLIYGGEDAYVRDGVSVNGWRNIPGF